MKWINKHRGIINIILLSLIIIYNLFFDCISINYDYTLIFLLFAFNIDRLFLFFKKNLLISILFILFGILNIFQVIFYSNIIGVYDFIYSSRFLFLTIFPLILLITIDSLGLSKKEINIVKSVFAGCLIVLIVYGFITYIFDINLYEAGMHVLNGGKGRVVSFFTNPNGYGLFLLFSFIYFLFCENINKLFKWIMVSLIVASICLTFGRTVYFFMILTIFVYIVYNIIKKGNKEKYKNIILIVTISLLSLYMPNNNYYFISLTCKFDQATNLEITKPVYKIVDTIVLLDYDTPSEKLYNNIIRTEGNVNSSTSTRKLFKSFALKIYKKNKYTGVGFNNYFDLMDKEMKESVINYVDGHLPHNFYVLLLVSTGIVGTIIFGIILVYFGYYIFKNKKLLGLYIYIIYLLSNTQGDFMLGTYFVYIIIALTVNMEYNKFVVKERIK